MKSKKSKKASNFKLQSTSKKAFELSKTERGKGGYGSTGTSQCMSEHKKKKIQFTDTDIRHAQLKIRLERENISQADFFRACVSGMSDNDKDLMSFIRRYKDENNIGRKRDIKITKKEDEQADDLMAKFGIKDDELESIFDLIAEEHPEL